MHGTFKAFDAGTGTLILSYADRLDSHHELAPGCTVYLNGQLVRIADLRRGDRVALIGEPVVSINVRRPIC